MDANLYLAQKLYEAGDFIGSEEICLSILDRARKASGANLLLAQISYDNQDYQTSLAYLAEAESGNFTTAKHSNLAGLNYYACNEVKEARSSFETAIAADQNFGGAHRNLGILVQEAGDIKNAVTHFCRALDIERSDLLSRNNLLNALLALDWTYIEKTKLSQNIRRHLEDCFRISDFGIKRYLPVACAAIRASNYFLQATKYFSSARSDKTVPLADQAWYSELVNDPLLQALLQSDVIPVFDIENIMTKIRHQHLMSAVTHDQSLDYIPFEFVVSVACQAYLTEYAYYCSDQELRYLRELQANLSNSIEPGSKLQRLDTVKLIISASYLSLGDWLDKVPETQEEGLTDLLDMVGLLQIPDTLEKSAGLQKIKTVSSIKDLTSLDVKNQYEQYPFPRWSILTRPKPNSVAETLQHYFPEYQPPKKLFGPCSILIAGCGTGHQPILAAMRYSSSQITALDISRNSLTYAIRKSNQYKTYNINFLQGDILEIGELDQLFDVIECVGVLHHMAEPLAGWKALVSRLSPGGVMKIGLYSERARRHVSEVRNWIGERGFLPTTETIRDMRRNILALPADDTKREVASFTDFYSISGARDLLFHVQESTFTFPDIRSALAALDLQLIGLQLSDPAIKNLYQKTFPNDALMTNLDNWEKLEIRHPGSFRGMYIFWCQ